MSAKGNGINSEAALCRSLLRGWALAGMAIVLGLMANFLKNLFIDVSLGRTPLLYYDLSRVPLYRSNHRISTVKSLVYEKPKRRKEVRSEV